MLGWLCWSEGRERAGRAEIAGLPVLRVPVRRKNGTPEWLLRRRVRAAGRTLARAGVRRAILPEEFPYGELLAGEGVFPVETLPLWRALAAELAWRELQRRGVPAGSVAVRADALTGEVRRTVETLLRRCRTVSLDAPDPEGAYARVLRRRLGAALRTGDAGAEVRLLFVRRGPERAGDIPLYPGAEGPKAALRLPEAWEARMPKGAQREGVIAALLAAGRLQREEIAIDSA